jgi:hypothetical protein
MVDDAPAVLLERFRKLGGKVNQYYLRQDRSSGRVLVNLNGWFGGKNLNEAINKAIISQSSTFTGSAGNT